MSVRTWRTQLGVSTKLWAAQGHHVVEDDWWIALSKTKSVDYNAILCHGDNGAEAFARSLNEVRDANVPAVIMVAGAALGMTNALNREGWVCVGAKPLMVMTDIDAVADPDARRLQPEELADAQAIISDAFDVAPKFAEIALPSVAASDPTREAWGVFDDGALVSCVGAVTVDNTIVIWSMATPRALQGRGYGRRLLSSVLAASRANGADTSILYASAPGEPLYRSVGYTVVEHWQVWSRPRWVFPPA
jgi:GNAT superfamily N-acetyltransferase